MELWATGFNAWGQLNFDESVPIESPDLPSFTLILEDGEIEVRALYEAATLGKLFELEYLLFCPDCEFRGIYSSLESIGSRGHRVTLSLSCHYISGRSYL
jgi:hypothetical protein